MLSPLRMSPGAGLDFGNQAVGNGSTPLTIALFNDPSDPNAATINFTGNLVRGDYAETDDCESKPGFGEQLHADYNFQAQDRGIRPRNHHHRLQRWTEPQTIHLRGTGQ